MPGISTPSRGRRIGRGGAALIVLIGLLAGVPAVLYRYGGDPLPHRMPSGAGIVAAFTRTDHSGHLFLAVALGVAWLGWAAFALSTLLEIAARTRRRPAPRIPGLAVPRRAAAGLITAIALMAGSGGLAGSAFAAAPATTAAPPAAVVVIGDPVPAGSVGLPSANPSTLVYTVARGDNLGTIAQRFLGTFNAYPRLVTANPTLITHGADHIQPGWRLSLPADARDGGARVHATGRLTSTLLESATIGSPDTTTSAAGSTSIGPTGTGASATGSASTGPTDTGSADTGSADTGSPGTGPTGTGPTGTGPTGTGPTGTGSTPIGSTDTGTSASGSTSTGPTGTGGTGIDFVDAGTGAGGARLIDTITGPVVSFGAVAPAGSIGLDATPPLVTFGAVQPLTPPRLAGPNTGAGASDALVTAALAMTTTVLGGHLLVWQRRRRTAEQRHAGTGPVLAAVPVLDPEHEVVSATELNRLDLALRDLAGLLGDRDRAGLPDIMGSWIADGAVHLMLTEPCPAPPAPWVAHGPVWTLPAHVPAHTWFSGTTPPLPALVTVGGGDDRTVLLDLERLGVVTIGGDPHGAHDLLRHIGAELSHGIWSETVTVGIAGFDEADTRRLTELGQGRVFPSASVAGALDRAGRWIDEAHERLAGMGVNDVLRGRVSATPAQARRLSPYALLIAQPEPDDLERLERVDAYLAGLGRGQLAIAATQRPGTRFGAGSRFNRGRWPLTVDADHTVTMEFLDTRVPAVALGGDDLAHLATAGAAAIPAQRTGEPAGGPDVPVGRHRTHRRQPVA